MCFSILITKHVLTWRVFMQLRQHGWPDGEGVWKRTGNVQPLLLQHVWVHRALRWRLPALQSQPVHQTWWGLCPGMPHTPKQSTHTHRKPAAHHRINVRIVSSGWFQFRIICSMSSLFVPHVLSLLHHPTENKCIKMTNILSTKSVRTSAHRWVRLLLLLFHGCSVSLPS